MPAATAAAILAFGFASCASPNAMATSLQRLLEEAPGDAVARYWLDGDRIVAAAVPLGPGSLPPAVRTTIDAVAPGGTTLFVGREWSNRGEGYRIEKRYDEPAHVRSALIAGDGRVLERAHSVPIAGVPQPVLATALRSGPIIDEAFIVSGPEREEFWLLLVRERSGRASAVRVGLTGADLGRTRRTAARVDS